MSNWPANIVVLVFECRHGLAGDLANQPSNVDVSPKLGASVETFITFSENFNQSLERTTFPQAAANIVNFMRCNLQLLRIGLLHLLPCASSLYVYVHVYIHMCVGWHLCTCCVFVHVLLRGFLSCVYIC